MYVHVYIYGRSTESFRFTLVEISFYKNMKFAFPKSVIDIHVLSPGNVYCR